MDVLDTIIRSIEKSLKDKSFASKSDKLAKSKIYQKYILRWLTSCMRSQRAILMFLKDKENIELLLQIIEVIKDEEILANANKIFRIILRDDHKIHEMLVNNK